jgi:pseudaminic acid synthase
MPFKISTFDFESSNKTFIIAELSANHNQKYDIAIKTIEAAKEAGADAIKLQTYTADTITIKSDKEYFKIKGDNLWKGKTLYELYQEAYTPWDWQPKLKKIADDLGLILFSSPFDYSAVDFLEKMKVPAYKIASFEITDIPLIKYVAGKQKPVIISTGIAEEEDIQLAIEACKSQGNNQIALLKCTSSYPAPFEEINLKTIPDMQNKFNTIVGLSDHTLGISVPIAAVALGARIIEKHFILDKSVGGPDAAFSIEPKEFKLMVQSVREAEKSLGIITYKLSENVKNSRVFARSLFVVKDIKKGEIFTNTNIKSIRPSNGLHPKFLNEILGKKAKRDIKTGTPFSRDLIE